MPWTSSAPRVLLRQLREVMARPGIEQTKQEDIQARFDRIVRLIAANMVAEVCSIYVRLPDGSFELYATEGLRKEAVHTTRLKPGEGLIGLVARTGEHVNVPDAQSHPAFSYRPETAEEIYQSFLGTPIMRGGRTIGVLTVQNAIARTYTDEEVEVLQTIALITAEMMSSLLESPNVATAGPRRTQSHTIKGITMSDGIALGHIVVHEPRVSIATLFAEDMQAEQIRLDAALGQLRENVDFMLQDREIARAGEKRNVLEANRMFAHDQGWVKRLHEAVVEGLTAEAAVVRVQSNHRARAMRQSDPFWRERLHDLDDLANRLLSLLTGRSTTASRTDLPRHTILVARTIGVAELLEYDRQCVRGLVLSDGGASSHVAIVAKMLGIPTIGHAHEVLEEVDSADPAVLDADAGVIHVRPSLEVIRAYADKVRFRARREAEYNKLRATLAVTKDGQRVSLHINAGTLIDMPHLAQSGAEGIGLLRTELLFMGMSALPRLEQQIDVYSKIIEAAGDKPIIFRSLDLRGDKIIPYTAQQPEENPALGWRAIRIALDRPGLFRTQTRALLRAAAGRELKIMLPFLADLQEFVAARKLIDKELAHLRRHGRPAPTKISLGAMIEVPSILWQLDTLLPVVDFISVGSNDLLQFIFAADRGNTRVSGRFDVLSLTALRVLRQIVVAADKHNVPVTLCGEMADRPLEALALIGLGYRSFSMAPASVGPVKAMILSVSASEIQRCILDLIENNREDIRKRLNDFAKKHDIGIGAALRELAKNNLRDVNLSADKENPAIIVEETDNHPVELDSKPASPVFADISAGNGTGGGGSNPPKGIRRIIDVNLLVERFLPNEIATLTVAILMPNSKHRGKWRGNLAVDVSDGPVNVVIDARGFEVVSQPPAALLLFTNTDTPPVAFQLRILAAQERWIHVMIMRAGHLIGELTATDFSAIGKGPLRQHLSSETHPGREADLTLIIRGDHGDVEAYSPSTRASLYGVPLGKIDQLADTFRLILDGRLKRLYDRNSNEADTLRELKLFGAELTSRLPTDLTSLLRREDIQTVMVRHNDNFEFPLELCYLDSRDDPFFLGDRKVVCRWYLGVSSPPDLVHKNVRKVALVQGAADAFAHDQNLLDRLFPGRTFTLKNRTEVIEKLFKTADFDIIHFTGHCGVDEKGNGGLELADRSFLRLIDVGQLESERKFAGAHPFVMLNACGSAQPYVAMASRDSFAHRFIRSHACAFIGTLWPVAATVANEVAHHLYQNLLRGIPLGQALLDTKIELINSNEDYNEANPSNCNRLAKQIAVRSYCVFSNPDLKIQINEDIHRMENYDA